MSFKLPSPLIALLLVIFSTAALSQSANPFIDTWDIDLEESDFGSAMPPANMSRTYFDHGDDTYTYMVITTAEDGSLGGTTTHYSYSGDRYPIASFDQD